MDREDFLTNAYNTFVTTGPAKRQYYYVILATLWPEDWSSLPGPVLSTDDIHRAINIYRRECMGKDRPYRDSFRRLRELQGEEGYIGVVRAGPTVQLLHTHRESPLAPRIRLADKLWVSVLDQYDCACAVCGATSNFDQDHKIPRSRGGTNDLDNWMPLCKSCNVVKSAECRGCSLDCNSCVWAFPEIHKPIRMSPELRAYVTTEARRAGMTPDEWVEATIYETDRRF